MEKEQYGRNPNNVADPPGREGARKFCGRVRRGYPSNHSSERASEAPLLI
jgi:hypothetical protein